MGLYEKATKYNESRITLQKCEELLGEDLENNAGHKLSMWYKRGPPLLGKPMTEEEIDRRIREKLEKTDPKEFQKFVDEALRGIGT